MSRILALVVILVSLGAPARAEMGPCVAHASGDFALCGNGDGAAIVIRDTVSPSKQLALAWRNPGGAPTERPDDDDKLELVIVRLKDGAALATSNTEFWDTGEMHVNRLEERATWSPDSTLMIRHFHSRFSTDIIDLYALDADKSASEPFDLLKAIGPAVRKLARPRAKDVDDYDLALAWMHDRKAPLTIDNRGRIGARVMLWVPKNGPFYYFNVVAQVAPGHTGAPSARITSVKLLKREGRSQ